MLHPRFLFTRFSALIFVLCCLSSAHSLAANVSTKLVNVLNQPVMQSLEFGQDLRSLEADDTISLTLGDNLATTFVVTSNTMAKDGTAMLKATSTDGINLLLTSDKDATYGSIIGNGVKYTVSSDKELGTVLVNQNHAEFPEIDLGEDGITPPGMLPNVPGIAQMRPENKLALKTQEFRSAQMSSSGSSIRMLILYSNEFANGFSSPTARINQLLQFTNQSMQGSGIDVEFTLGRAQVLNFNNDLTTSTILQQVQAGTGAFSGVASLRDQVGADMVAVLSFQPGFSANGVAYVNGMDDRFAFSSTRLSPGCCDSVFAHELGHNMGSGHERVSANPGASSPCNNSFTFTDYSCGHGDASGNNGQGWGTIMSRLNSQVVNNVFSNPNLSCLGEPCGIPEGQSNQADNVRSFNISRLLVANFRDDPPTPPPPPPPGNPSSGTTIITPILGFLLDDD